LWYDFRNPTQWRQASDRLYGEILEQIAWAENNGFDDVWLSEHHFIEDGYLPSMLPAAAAIAARTKRIRIPLGVLLMPFHNPVRLAEDIAVVDAISGRRASSLGLGSATRSRNSRVSMFRLANAVERTNEALQIIRRLLDGETLTFKGKFFEFRTSSSRRSRFNSICRFGSAVYRPPALRRAARYWRQLHAPDASRQDLRRLPCGAEQTREAD
jgi:alkanesulfonate monooxygenase SsuD/methylene tetrahydromethanopterin reductase-like flavin-dependent oxidoreductase (luciferase family)